MGLITDEVLVRFFVELRIGGSLIDPDDVATGLRELCHDNGGPSPRGSRALCRYHWRNQTPHGNRPTIKQRYPALIEALDAAEIVIVLQAGDVNG